MFKRLSMSMAEHGNIEEKYIDLYAEGMRMTVAKIVNLIATLIISYYLGVMWYCIALLIVFYPLRSYAGGYHAGNYVSCFLESCVFLAVALYAVKYCVATDNRFIIVILMIALIAIFLWSPMADANKPITELEDVTYGRMAKIIGVVASTVGIGLFYLNIDYGYAVMMGVILSAFLLLLYRMKELTAKFRNKDFN